MQDGQRFISAPEGAVESLRHFAIDDIAEEKRAFELLLWSNTQAEPAVSF